MGLPYVVVHTFYVVSHPDDLLHMFSVHSLHHMAENIHNKMSLVARLPTRPEHKPSGTATEDG